MADLYKLEDQIPKGGLNRYRGVMVMDGGVLAVNVNGNVLPASYADPVVVALGDSVVVDMLSGETGQAEAVVMGRVTGAPRPGRATVKTVPVGSPTITVTGTDGVDYVADFVSSYTPATGNVVVLAWNAATPTITGKVGATAPPDTPPPPVLPPPPPTSSGTANYRCVDAATYWSGGGWESVTSARGGKVLQGIVYGTANQVQGSWFYGGSPQELAGSTISGARIRLPARLGIGNFNSPVTIGIQCHNSARRPGGAVSFLGPVHNVSLPAGWGGGEVAVPVSFGEHLVAGGGWGIVGTDYAGFPSRTDDPSTGQAFIDWNR